MNLASLCLKEKSKNRRIFNLSKMKELEKVTYKDMPDLQFKAIERQRKYNKESESLIS